MRTVPGAPDVRTDTMLTKWLGHRLMCKDVSRLLSQAQDGTLPLVQRWKVQAHLRICAACANVERQMRFMREAARRWKS